MFRKMRRVKQQLDNDMAARLLAQADTGVLALLGDNDYPYAVPLNFAYDNNAVYFHSAKEGHKIDSIRKHCKASFCVVSRDKILPEKFATDYVSVILFGRAQIVSDDSERVKALRLLADKYSPNDESGFQKELDSALDRVCIVRLDIDHLTAKKSIFTEI